MVAEAGVGIHSRRPLVFSRLADVLVCDGFHFGAIPIAVISAGGGATTELRSSFAERDASEQAQYAKLYEEHADAVR